MYVNICICVHVFSGTVSEVGTSACTYRCLVPPGGTQVDVMGIDRPLQSMTRVGARAGSRRELLALLYSYNGLYSIYIYICIYSNAQIRVVE